MKKALVFIFVLICSQKVFADDLYPVIMNEKIGYIDSRGDVIIEPQFNVDIDSYLFEQDGEYIEGVEFPKNTKFHNGIATMMIKKTFWYFFTYDVYIAIDTLGFLHSESETKQIKEFKNGIAPFIEHEMHFKYKYDYKYGYMNANFGAFISPKYIYASLFNDDSIALVLEEPGYTFINLNEEKLFSKHFHDAKNFNGNLAPVEIFDKWAYIDKTGEIIIDPTFDEAWQFNSGFARVVGNNLFYYIDKSGKSVFNKKFDFANDFSEGMACVSYNNKTNFIDPYGEFLLAKPFEDGKPFSEGLAAVKIDKGRWGYIDKTGKFAITAKFDYAKNFENNLAIVWFMGVQYYIDKSGELISRVVFE